MFNLHFMKVSTENDNNFGYEKITIVVDNIPLNQTVVFKKKSIYDLHFMYISIQRRYLTSRDFSYPNQSHLNLDQR